MNHTYDTTYDTFYFTRAGQIVTSISGALSFIGSATINVLILKSGTRLSTTYHRIMFFISCADILSSAMVCLTTIPMPKDTLYPFEGGKYGTVQTCEAQGFIYICGMVTAVCGNAGLNIYYLCTIRYKMSEERIKKFVEPVLFCLSLVAGLTPAIQLLQGQYLNPQPFESYCGMGGYYPKECKIDDGVECIRGDPDSNVFQRIRNAFLFTNISLFLVIVVSMILIILTVHRAEKSKRKPHRAARSSNDHELPSSEREGLHDAKKNPPSMSNEVERTELMGTILRQALMYIGAYFFTNIFIIMTFITPDVWAIQICRCVFQPLQGFFNALIFIYHKVYNVLQGNDDMTFYEALLYLYYYTSKVPEIFFSSLYVVEENAGVPNDNVSSCVRSEGISFETPRDSTSALSSTHLSYEVKDEALDVMKKDDSEITALSSMYLSSERKDETLDVIQEDNNVN